MLFILEPVYAYAYLLFKGHNPLKYLSPVTSPCSKPGCCLVHILLFADQEPFTKAHDGMKKLAVIKLLYILERGKS